MACFVDRNDMIQFLSITLGLRNPALMSVHSFHTVSRSLYVASPSSSCLIAASKASSGLAEAAASKSPSGDFRRIAEFSEHEAD